MNEIISIIVPVYNVENYLRKCLNSIIHQTYSAIQIILIDDGSTDTSGSICDEFASMDSRICVIHQPNQGLAVARNKGLELASGSYIGFVDSDDFIDTDMYETLYKNLKETQSDISMITYRQEANQKIIEGDNSKEITIYTQKEALEQLLLDDTIHSLAWDKLYKKELFNDIYYPIGKNYEDISTTFHVFEKIKKLVFIHQTKYTYVVRDNGIVKTKSLHNTMDYYEAILSRYEYLKANSPELKQYNEYAYINSMIIIYKMSIAYNIPELLEIFNTHYNNFLEIYKKNTDFLLHNLSNFQKIILHIILWKKNDCNDVVKRLAMIQKEDTTTIHF